MTNANFGEARLLSCVFDGSDLCRTRFENAFIVNTTFEDKRIGNTNLNDADFRGAVLIDVDLRGANLFRANLSGALLINVDLRDANLCDANLTGAHFIGVNVDRADVADDIRQQCRPDHPVNLAGALLDRSDVMLRELSAHLLGTYVLARHQALDTGVGKSNAPGPMRSMTFAQVMNTLKMQLDLPELELFSVSGRDVFVRANGREVLLSTSPQTGNTPDPLDAPEPPQRPTRSTAAGRATGGGGAPGAMAADPFGGGPRTSSRAERAASAAAENVRTRDVAPPPARTRDAAPPAPTQRSRPPAPTPAPEPATREDRFGMLEID